MDKGQIIEIRHNLFKALREFFYRKGYYEVETPFISRFAPPDPYIEPLRVYVGKKGPFYLHTSPEMAMKKLLVYGKKRIFQICKVFREERKTHLHRTEFTMVEWYREGNYKTGMEELEEMLGYLSENLFLGERKELFKGPFKVFELERLFEEFSPLNPFALQKKELLKAMKEMGLVRKRKRAYSWNDLFFILFFTFVEDRIREDRPYFLIDWPVSISNMAKKKDEKKVERFELYMEGIEIANGYTELLDPEEQRERFMRENEERKRLKKETFKIDEGFLSALSGLSGSFTGISLGLERLLMVFLGKRDIGDVILGEASI